MVALFSNTDFNARTHSAVQPDLSNPAWGNQFSDRLGYDGSGRPITKRYVSPVIDEITHAYGDPTAIVGFTTVYDKASNKLYERALHAENRSHLYEPYSASNQPIGGYDSLNRLRQYQRGTLPSTGGPGNAGGGSVTSPITLPNTNELAQYELDGLGNWRRFTTDPVGGASSTQIRQHNGLNEITRVDSTNFEYDGVAGASNSNLINDGTLKYEWDALNRLVKVYKTPSSPVIIATYTYDALNRRIQKVMENGGLSGTIPDDTHYYRHSGWQCVEEYWSDAADVTRQYVWGIYLDELIQIYNDDSIELHYPLQDLLYRTTALTNESGQIVEAYDYDAYGNTLIFSAAGTGGNWWADDATQSDDPYCTFLFTGQRYDAETRNYYYKRRYYSPEWGRFLSRDPINDFVSTILVPYLYAFAQPTRQIDPSGLTALSVLEANALIGKTDRCTTTIIAGHNNWVLGWSTYLLKELLKDVKKDKTGLGFDPVDSSRIGPLGCRIEERLRNWPDPTLRNNLDKWRIPGFPTIDKEGKPGLISVEDVPQLMNDAMKAAEQYAQDSCYDSGCNTVTVRFVCQPAMAWAVQQNPTHPLHQQIKHLCGGDKQIVADGGTFNPNSDGHWNAKSPIYIGEHKIPCKKLEERNRPK